MTIHYIVCKGKGLTAEEYQKTIDLVLGHHGFCHSMRQTNSRNIKYSRCTVENTLDSRDMESSGLTFTYAFSKGNDKIIYMAYADGTNIFGEANFDNLALCHPNSKVTHEVREGSVYSCILQDFPTMQYSDDEYKHLTVLGARFMKTFAGSYNGKSIDSSLCEAVESFGAYIDADNTVNVLSIATHRSAKALREFSRSDTSWDALVANVDNIVVHDVKDDQSIYRIYDKKHGLVFRGYLETQRQLESVASMVGLRPVW